jgi:hypothetical protein
MGGGRGDIKHYQNKDTTLGLWYSILSGRESKIWFTNAGPHNLAQNLYIYRYNLMYWILQINNSFTSF